MPFVLHAKEEKHKCENRVRGFLQYLINTFSRFMISMASENDYKFDAKKLCIPDNYTLPLPQTYYGFYDLPTLYQIVNNHFALHFSRQAMAPIKLFTIDCKFHVLFVRNDGLALVYIDRLTTLQIICEAPIHCFEGTKLMTENFFSWNNATYMPLCMVWLNTDHIYNVNDEHNNESELVGVNEPKETDRFVFKANGNEFDNIPERLRLFIDGCDYC